MPENSVNLLLIEDDEIDAERIERALHAAKIANPVYHAWDGVEALEMLRGTHAENNIPRPYLILLDLKLPRMNGHKFLEEIRRDPDLRDSVVFILTTSDAELDKVAAYEKNVAGYMVKSRAGEDFMRLVAMLDNYWRIVELSNRINVARQA
jgi:CheY-like chemotaxis protein